jgi:hypothetical protein
MVARDGIEPPTPAFSGPLTESLKGFEINGCHWARRCYDISDLGWFGAVLGSSMFAYCSRPPSLCIARPRRSIGLNKSSSHHSAARYEATFADVSAVKARHVWLGTSNYPAHLSVIARSINTIYGGCFESSAATKFSNSHRHLGRPRNPEGTPKNRQALVTAARWSRDHADCTRRYTRLSSGFGCRRQ